VAQKMGRGAMFYVWESRTLLEWDGGDGIQVRWHRIKDEKWKYWVEAMAEDERRDEGTEEGQRLPFYTREMAHDKSTFCIGAASHPVPCLTLPYIDLNWPCERMVRAAIGGLNLPLYVPCGQGSSPHRHIQQAEATRACVGDQTHIRHVDSPQPWDYLGTKKPGL
jgi:hypothetical protein